MLALVLRDPSSASLTSLWASRSLIRHFRSSRCILKAYHMRFLFCESISHSRLTVKCFKETSKALPASVTLSNLMHHHDTPWGAQHRTLFGQSSLYCHVHAKPSGCTSSGCSANPLRWVLTPKATRKIPDRLRHVVFNSSSSIPRLSQSTTTVPLSGKHVLWSPDTANILQRVMSSSIWTLRNLEPQSVHGCPTPDSSPMLFTSWSSDFSMYQVVGSSSLVSRLSPHSSHLPIYTGSQLHCHVNPWPAKMAISLSACKCLGAPLLTWHCWFSSLLFSCHPYCLILNN